MKAWESGVMVADLFQDTGYDDMTRAELLRAAHEARSEGSVESQKYLLRVVRVVDVVDATIMRMMGKISTAPM